MRNRDRFLYSVALFLSMLMITIPFYTASVYASIQAKITGTDGVTGYTKDDFTVDDIVYQVVVDPVPANATVQVNEIYALPNLYFSDPNFCDKGASCTAFEVMPGVKRYNCTCTDDWTPTGMAQTFTFAYDESNSPPPEATSAPVVVRQDYKPPVITNFQLTNAQNAIEVTYSITDKACDYAGCTCTGVAGFEIKDEKSFSKSQTITPNPRSCTETGTFRFNYTGGDGKHNFTLRATDKLWKSTADDQKHASLKVTKSLVVDTTPPQVSDLKATRGGLPLGFVSTTGASGVDLAVKVTDSSAIRSVTFNLAEFGGGTSNANCVARGNNVYNCTLKGVNIRLVPPQTSGKVTITAEDTFGNKATVELTLTFQIDSSPPTLSGFIVTKAGVRVGYVASTGINGVDFEVLATDPSGVKSVSFNLAEFGGGLSNANCALVSGTVYNCTLSGVNINLHSGQTSGKVTINSEDTFGNKGSKNETLTFQVDRTGPVYRAMAIYPSVTARSKTYIGSIINVSASITETESGLGKDDVLLSFQGGLIPAANCTSGWVCEWHTLNVPSMLEGSQIVMSVSGKDLVGNTMTGIKQEKFYADTVAPRLISSSVTSAETGIVIINESIIKKGDTVEIEYNFTDMGSGVAYFMADLSELIGPDGGDYENATGTCTVAEGFNYTCTITTPAIHPTTNTPQIKITAMDAVLNKFEEERTVQVYGVSATAVNCFDIKIDEDYILPIEVNTLQYFPGVYYEVVPFTLSWTGECNDNTEIFNPTLVGDCSGGSRVNIASGIGGGDISGFFQFAIDPASINPAWANIEIGGDTTTCGLHYFDIVQRTVYTEPEIEDVNFKIPLANDLIPPDVNLDDEINKIRANVEIGYKKTIATLTKIIEIFQAICRIKQVLAAVQEGLAAIVALLAGCEALGIPVVSAACAGAEKGVQKVKEGADKVINAINNKVVNAICGFVTCDLPGKSFASYVFGGGACKFLRETIISRIPGLNLPIENKAEYLRALDRLPASNLEVSKKSWVFAIACLCIPGILYNVEKRRQIECWKGLCYRDMIQVGIPIAECNKQYGYQKCVYDKGFLGALIDFIGVSNLFNLVSSVLKNPIAHAWSAAKTVAEQGCTGTSSVIAGAACILAGGMGIFEAVETIKQYIQAMIDGSYWRSGRTDYCKQFLDPYYSTTTTASAATTTT